MTKEDHYRIAHTHSHCLPRPIIINLQYTRGHIPFYRPKTDTGGPAYPEEGQDADAWAFSCQGLLDGKDLAAVAEE